MYKDAFARFKDEFARKIDGKWPQLPADLRTHLIALAEQTYSNYISALKDPANEPFYQGEIADATLSFITRVSK